MDCVPSFRSPAGLRAARPLERRPPSLASSPGLLVLLACSVEQLGAGGEHRAARLAGAVLASYGATRAREPAERNVQLFWTRLAGAVLVAAAFKAVYAHADAGWAAAALLLFAAVAVAWAILLRDHVWMFVAGCAANLAVFFLVHNAFVGAPLEAWWVPLVQWEVLTSGAMAILWLAIQPRFNMTHRGWKAMSRQLTAAPVLVPVLFRCWRDHRDRCHVRQSGR